ncbi:MAG: 16S rRNA (cytidine(1402)-2'-O)-methyltransferase [Legionella sp.]
MVKDSSAILYGTLYIVATPIGNRDDMTFRALDILKRVDAILAEDTRYSGQFLSLLGIKKPLISLHAHNEDSKSEMIVRELLGGKSYALISDAGTPLISDPGFPLVKLARANQINVVPIPGACALIAALSAAGVPCDLFTFAGFLPAKSHARQQKLISLKTYQHTVVFYESMHRILDSIRDIAQVYGIDCQLVLAKELSKSFEHFISGDCNEVIAWLLAETGRCKGEFVLIIPPRTSIHGNEDAAKKLLSILLVELPLKQAVRVASKLTISTKNELYRLALSLSTPESVEK